MKKQFPSRLEIFLALALQQIPTAKAAENALLPELEPETIPLPADHESEISGDQFSARFPAINDYLKEAEVEQFRQLWTDYAGKTPSEKTLWREEVRRKIGTDEQLIDEQVHRSHINEALQREIPAVQRIVGDFLPQSYKKSVDTFTQRKKRNSAAGSNLAANASEPTSKTAVSPLEKTVRCAFARQFVALRDLEKPTAFDRLDGAQLARLIRLTGIREVATACVRIEAVEAVAAFLRIFSAEDAQAIASQLNNLAKISDARLDFAEHLVQNTLEAESQPSAMLDLLGIWLIGILLCSDEAARVRYTNQKLPLEIASKLPEIIDEQCRQMPVELQREVSAEIERLAETLISHGKR